MNAFWTTLQIVGGILSPLIILFLAWALKELVGLFKLSRECKLEILRKKPPFDTIESSIRLEDNVMAIRLVKGGEVVYEGNVTKEDMMR